MKKLTTIMLALVLIMTNVLTVQGETAANDELRNPRMVVDATMDAKQKVSWDVVTFGSYPQAEIVSTAGKESYSAVASEFLREGDVIADDTVYQKLSQLDDSAWDSEGDTELDGVKYRRINYGNSKQLSSGPTSSRYDWGGVIKFDGEDRYLYESRDESYHYFKYEPIRWRVLNVDDDILLLSDVALDAFKFYDDKWDASSMRDFLNGYEDSYIYKKGFIEVAFNENEKDAIVPSHLNNNGMLDVESDMPDTEDKIFLLSDEEVLGVDAEKYGFVAQIDVEKNGDLVNKFFDEAKCCGSSTYAKAMGCYIDNNPEGASSKYKGNCEWHLRTYSNGRSIGIGTSGEKINGGEGNRPALRISKSYQHLLTKVGVVSSDKSNVEVAGATCNHNWGDGVVIEKPRAATVGIKKYTCSLCGKIRNTVLPPDSIKSEDGVWRYRELSDGTIEIAAYLVYDETEVVIPDQIDGKTVSAIGSYAFYTKEKYYYQNAHRNIENVIIPNHITNIESSAFHETTWMENLLEENDYVVINGNLIAANSLRITKERDGVFKIPEGVITVGYGVIDGDAGEDTGVGYRLRELYIPSSVKNMSLNSFDLYTNYFEKIIVDEDNPYFDSRNNCNALINSETNELILGCQNTVIPNTVTKLGEKAFYRVWNAKTLCDVIIPDSVTEIGDRCFYDTSIRGKLIIPGSVKKIGEYAFYFCLGLKQVILEDGVESIGKRCFYDWIDLRTLVIPDSVTYMEDILDLDYEPKIMNSRDTITVFCSKGSYAEQWCIEAEKTATIYNGKCILTHNTTDDWRDVSVETTETTESTETSTTEVTTTQVSTTTQVQTQGTTQKQITTQEKVTPNATPKTQKISIAKMKTFKAKKLKKKKQVFSLKARAKGKLTYKVVKGKSKYITVNKKGVVTLKKGCKKGIYKIKITAAKTTGYKKTTKVVVIKVS